MLEISIEPDEFEHLGRALVDEWPAYLAYVTSFLTVGSVWIAHHTLFTYLRFVDPVLLRLNLLLLMAAAFLPFPTAVLAQSFDHSEDAERAAVVFYGISALVIELLLRTTVRYARSKPELTTIAAPEAGERPVAPLNFVRELLSSLAYAVAILIGVFTFPRIAAAAYLLVALRGVFVIGGEGRLTLSALRSRSH